MGFLKRLLGKTKNNEKDEDNKMNFGFKVGKYISFDASDYKIFLEGKTIIDLDSMKDIGLVKKSEINTDYCKFDRFYSDCGFVERIKEKGKDYSDKVTYYQKIYEEVLTEVSCDEEVPYEFGDKNTFEVNDVMFKRMDDSEGLVEFDPWVEVYESGDSAKLFSMSFFNEIDEDHFELMMIEVVFENGYYKKNLYVGMEFEKNKYELI